MPKYRVSVSYCIWTYENYEVEIDPEDVEDFHEDPVEFICDQNKVEDYTGDVMNGTWETQVHEINALDQIVEAVVDDAD